MVLARRYNERRLAEAFRRGFEKGQRIADERWIAWYAQLPQAVRDKYPPPPPPDERP